MRHLEIALAAPGIGTRPRVLVLWGADEDTQGWLSERGATVESGYGPEEFPRLVDSTEHWDVVVATLNTQRFHDTVTRGEAAKFSRWLRTHSTVCLLTPRKSYVDPARNSIGPWRLDLEFSEFTFLSEVACERPGQPVVLLSDQAFWDGENWRPRKDFIGGNAQENEMKTPPEEASKRRQHLSTDGTIFKVELGSPEYFDSVDIIKEAEVIQALDPSTREFLGIPEFLSLRRGAAVSTLHRRAIAGTPLLEVEIVDDSTAKGLARLVVSSAIAYSRCGLFHNDFRPWNFIVSGERATLIDYAGVSRQDMDARSLPQVVALFGTIIAVGGYDIGDRPLRLFEQFDTDTWDFVAPIRDSLGFSLESLYTERWLELPSKEEALSEALGAGISEIARVLFTPISS